MRIGLLIVALLFLSLAAAAQEPLKRDFWLNESNTPVNANSLLQDSRGYLWIGADDGLYRFNGRALTKIADSIHQPVTALAGGNGVIYAGFADGRLGIVSHDTVLPLAIKNKVPHSAIRYMYDNGAGSLWLCTEEGIFDVINNNMGFVIDASSGLTDNFTYMLTATADKILVGTDQGINNIQLKAGRLQISAYTSAQGLPDNIVKVIQPTGEKNTFWIGTQDGGIAMLKGSKLTKYEQPWDWGEINDIVAMPGNRAWVATRTGYLLEVMLDSGFHIKPHLFKDRKINRILLTKTGNIWCATNKGITIVTAEYASGMTVPAPYSMDSLSSMAIDGTGKLWFAENTELYVLNMEDSARKPKHVMSAKERITCLYADARDILWIGTLGKGVWYIAPGKSPGPVNGIEALDNGSILSIAGKGDAIWIAGLNGVEEIEYKAGIITPLHHYSKLSGIGSDYVYRLYEDRAGNMWMATDGAGVCMFDGTKFHTWDSASGFKSKVVYSLAQDAAGNIWAATLDKGLFRYDGSSWKQFAKASGLRDLNISSVTANATGQLVVVHQKGIDEWYNSAGDFRHFNSRTGLGIDSITNVLNCSATDRQGNVYVPYDKGFLLFRNSPGYVNFTPSVNITDILLFFKSVVSHSNRFSHDAHDITIRFDGISYTYVEQMNYRYMLEGYNKTWINTRDEEVTFLELPAGKYRFRVQAALKGSFDKYSEADYDFTIAAPFWKTPWFLALCLLGAFALISFYVRSREKSLRKVSQLQEERMMFEYEHLKSQVNPHFLFNSLNTLASLIEESQENAIDYTVQLSDLYRHILTFRDKDLVLLREEIEILRSYIYIQESRFGNALVVNINIPESLLTSKSIVPLALQLLVENAIKHNIVSQAIPLTINIVADENEISVRNTLQPKYSKEKGSGLGLVNIYKRYRLLTKRKITYGPENNEYVVKLPLL